MKRAGIILFMLMGICCVSMSLIGVKKNKKNQSHHANEFKVRPTPSNFSTNGHAIPVLSAPTCTTAVTLTGAGCTGSVLTATSNSPIASIKWIKNGTGTVSSQTFNLQDNSTIVAGADNSGVFGPNTLYTTDRIFVDKKGALYVTDYGAYRVQKWDAGAKNGTTVAGGNGGGTNNNQLLFPSSIWVEDDGSVLVTDRDANRVQKWAPGATQGVTVAVCDGPTCIFKTADGSYYVTEQGYTWDILKFSSDFSTRVVVAGGNGVGNAANQFYQDTGIWVDANGSIYVCDSGNNRIQRWDKGATSGVTVVDETANYNLYSPLAIILDNTGNIYTSNLEAVLKTTPDGSSVPILTLVSPAGLWLYPDGSLLVAEGDRVVKYFYPTTATYTPTTPGVYTAQITSTDGCTAISNPITITDKDILSVKITANTNVVCPAFAPVFTAVPVNAGANPTYQWMVNGDAKGAESTNASFTISGLKNGDVVSCQIRSSSPCVTYPLAQSNGIAVTDKAMEAPSITITSDKTITCPEFPVTFTATVVNSGDNPGYTWLVNGATAPGAANSPKYITSQLSGGDKVSCQVISNAQNCQAISTASSNNIQVSSPTETPSVTVAANNTSVCVGTAITFTATATNSGNAPVYAWFVNNQPAPGAGPGNTYSSSSLANADAITCKVTSNAQYCQASYSATSNVVPVTIKPFLTPAVSVVKYGAEIFSNSVVKFEAKPVNGGTNPIYTWLLNGVSVGQSDPVYVVSGLREGDRVSCILNNTTDCLAANNVSSNVYIVHISLSLFDLTLPNTFTPNGDGVNDTWQIKGLETIPNVTVKIFDRSGNQLFFSNGYPVQWDGTYKGKPCVIGTYYYVIADGKSHPLGGSITIVK